MVALKMTENKEKTLRHFVNFDNFDLTPKVNAKCHQNDDIEIVRFGEISHWQQCWICM